MATPEKLSCLAKNRGAVKRGFLSSAEVPKNTLDDPQAQNEIVHPATITVKIGGEPYELHPLSSRRRMGLIGLIHGIAVSSFQDDVRIGGSALAFRMRAIVAERYLERLMPIVAAATGEPGELKQNEIDQLAIEFLGEDGIQYDEITPVIDAITVQNDVWEEIRRSVQGTEPEKK